MGGKMADWMEGWEMWVSQMLCCSCIILALRMISEDLQKRT
jgi:hypothetical protein